MSKGHRVRAAHPKGPPKEPPGKAGAGNADGTPPGGYVDGDESYPLWFKAADAFTEGCRLYSLSLVRVEVGPTGSVDLRGVAEDPVNERDVSLRVYFMKEGALAPEHWLAVGNATGPAHDVDPAYPDLLSALPDGTRDVVRIAIATLHSMAHDALAVVLGKVAEMQHALQTEANRLTPRMQEALLDHVVEDAIEGLNGIARLYTGTRVEPDEIPRPES